jgi:hypothetical protein
VAPGDETAATPTDVPADAPEFAGEIPRGIGGGAVQLAYLHPGQVSHSWHMSMMNAIAYDKSVGLNMIERAPLAVSCSGPNSLVEGRNFAAKHFLDETDAGWLMFIDTDMGFEADAVERVRLAADADSRPVVGGLCFALKHMGPDGKGGFVVRPLPTLFMWGQTRDQGFGFVNRFRYPPETLVQVAGTGGAFLLIHRKVLEKIRADQGDTWFNFIQYKDGLQVSEDLSFCYRVGQLGFPIFVHSGVKVSHHKEFWLSEDDYRMPDEEPMAKLAVPGPPVVDMQTACGECGNVSCDGGWGCLPSATD